MLKLIISLTFATAALRQCSAYEHGPTMDPLRPRAVSKQPASARVHDVAPEPNGVAPADLRHDGRGHQASLCGLWIAATATAQPHVPVDGLYSVAAAGRVTILSNYSSS